MRKSIGRIAALAVALCLLLTGCSLTGSSAAENALAAKSDTMTISRQEYEQLLRFSELNELLNTVQAYYYIEPDTEAMIENAERGLMYGLEDPYTFYYNPQEYASMWEDDGGEYAGVGIQIMSSYVTYLCTISRVFANSPAAEAGLRKGDILVKVEDVDVTAYTLQSAVDIMRGEVATAVNVQVQRGDELLDFTIPRAVVHVNWVSSCMLEGDVGYISLYEFSGDCASVFQTQLNSLIDSGAKGLIIDLRDNPGGWVDDAVKVADIFLPEGNVTYLENRYGAREYYNTKAGALDIPLVVLINENSASSSEVLCGALQDRGAATLVGVTSFGKGIVQYVLPVGANGAGMQVTAAQYYTPNGHSVHKIGITPDVWAEMPEGDTTLYELGDLSDAQLRKGLEVVREMITEKNAK